jgi:FkbM family methyltransferase
MSNRPFRLLSAVLRNTSALRYVADSYSQEGEDMILSRLLEGQRSGFYVDVGAHHPFRFSNTFRFYLRGWRGINVDPNPETFALFARKRRRDVNLQIGISDVPGTLAYHRFDEPALNTFDAELAAHRKTATAYRLLGVDPVEVRRLDAVLDQHLPAGVAIDFMSIDTEGFDLKVLRSNDWQRFRPGHVLVEALQQDLKDLDDCAIHRHMSDQGYLLGAKTLNTFFYVDARRARNAGT